MWDGNGRPEPEVHSKCRQGHCIYAYLPGLLARFHTHASPLTTICTPLWLAAWQQPFVNVFKLCNMDNVKEVEVLGDVKEHMVGVSRLL